MDYLTHVYKSKMRLFRDRPDVLTEGRWYWCSEDAIPIPFMSKFVSSKWDSDGIATDPMQLGEVEIIPGYTSGVANARYTGQRFCGAQEVWENGALFAQQGTPLTDEDGVPLCCQEVNAVGGLAIEGQGIFVDLNSAAWWLNPLSLAGLSDGDPISVWPDSGRDGQDATDAGIPATVKGTNPDNGIPLAYMAPGASMGRPLNLVLGPELTMFVVGSAGIAGDGHAGPWLIGGAIGPQRSLQITNARVLFSAAGYALLAAFAQTPVALHIYSVRTKVGLGELSVDGAVLQAIGSAPSHNVLVGGLTTAVITLPQTRSSIWYEVLIFDSFLEDDPYFSVLQALAEKYHLPLGSKDVDTGTIICFGGATAPPGYLPCDGSAVSRTTYGALFTVLGTTWGVGDGSTTFNLPDFRGRLALGAGTGSGLTPRTLAATGGEETHLLTLSEIPSHQHDAHYQAITSTNVGADNVNSIVDASAGGSTFSTDSQGGDQVHNNVQPFAVVQYLVKT